MMAVFTSTLLLLLLVFCEQIQWSESKSCKSGRNCRKNQCCLANVRPIGKRSLQSPAPISKLSLSGGTCQPRGRRGSGCIVPFGNQRSWNDLVAMDVCPCRKGLKCVPNASGGVIVPQGRAGTCQPQSQIVGCNSASDCPAGECCVAPLRGKRALPSPYGGTCQPIPKKGGGCHKGSKTARYGIFVSCPCPEGLKCVPDGERELPQGLTGTCEPQSLVVGCNSPSDCPARECCVAPLRGKRALPSPKGGICQPIPDEGGRCHTTKIQVGDGMVASCPCPEGLKCVPDGKREVPQGPTGTCERVVKAPNTCSSAADCRSGMCCVAHPGYQTQCDQWTCQPKSAHGRYCNPLPKDVKPGVRMYSCQCADGLVCVGINSYDKYEGVCMPPWA